MPATHCGDPTGADVLPFEPVAPHAYLAKVKNLLSTVPRKAQVSGAKRA